MIEDQQKTTVELLQLLCNKAAPKYSRSRAGQIFSELSKRLEPAEKINLLTAFNFVTCGESIETLQSICSQLKTKYK